MTSSIEQLTKFFITQDLSNIDIKTLTGKEPYTYEELEQFSSLDDLLGNDGFAIILYQTTKTSGHWTAIVKNIHNNQIIFFDSYGLYPDSEIQYTQYNQSLPMYLTNLIKQSGQNIKYNNIDYQKWTKTTSTCGRWATISVKLLKHIDLPTFEQLFTTNQNSLINQPDFTATLLTLLQLNNISNYFKK